MSEEKLTETGTETVNTDTETDTDISSLSDEEFNKLFDSGEFIKSESFNNSDTSEETSSKSLEPEQENLNKEISTTEIENDTTDETNTEEVKEEPNYKEIVQQIFTEFKANGKTIKPETPEDVKSLMQMGANYGKKMTTIKQYSKQIQSLEDAEINTLDKLNFLIDIYKGDREAVKQLLKDNNIDPYELVDLDEINYTNTGKNIATDDTIEFSMALNEVKQSEYFKDIYEVLENKWDNKSKSEILNNTKLLNGLKEEFELGRFNDIQAKVDRERQFGRLMDMTDLEAYSYIVTQEVNRANQQQETKPVPKVTNKDIDVNKASTQPTQSNNKNNKPTKFSDSELASMSDEEFDRLYQKGYFK